jgi:hypothetical protein
MLEQHGWDDTDSDTERMLAAFDTLDISLNGNEPPSSYPERVLDHLFSRLTSDETTQAARYREFLLGKGEELRKILLQSLRHDVRALLTDYEDVSIEQ